MNHPEDDLQKLCVDYLTLLKIPFHHSPNGGKRNLKEAARFKRLGVSPGFPDLIIFLSGKRVVFVELKSSSGGRVSESQKDWMRVLLGLGYEWVLCWDFDVFKNTIDRLIQVEK